METDIFSIIETAKKLLGQLGLAEATIRTYQERSFNQIIRRYQENEDWLFCPDIMDELMLKAEEQHEQGILSRQSRNWRGASGFWLKYTRQEALGGRFITPIQLSNSRMCSRRKEKGFFPA
jgi:hypothetical protein